MKFKDANHKSHWNILVFCDQWKWCQVWMCRMENVWVCFISIVWVHFSHKTGKFWSWKSLKYFNIFWQKNIWCQIWKGPMEKCLNLFNFHQSLTKYLRLTLVFMWNSALRESLLSVFQEFFASINKIFILVGGLGARLSFYRVLRFSWYFLLIS